MAGIFFILILIGLPATFGALSLVRQVSDRERTAGGVLVFFALAITLVYVFVLPDGRMLRANYFLLAPATLVVGFIAGGLWGYFGHKSE